MEWRSEWKPFVAILAGFLLLYFAPVDSARVQQAVYEALALAHWYAQEHVILCLIPAFIIAGAMAAYVNSGAIIRFLGGEAPQPIAYGVASVSGTVLAVCSCTILPLFAGIYRMGAGLGPATAFLYSGPAINILAIVLTGAVLGPQLAIARAVGAVLFALVIGALMQGIFRREEAERQAAMTQPDTGGGPSIGGQIVFFASMIAVLVFANWGEPQAGTGVWAFLYENKWILAGAAGVVLAVILITVFKMKPGPIAATAVGTALLAFAFPEHPEVAFVAATVGLVLTAARHGGDAAQWMEETWGFTKQIVPLLAAGIVVAGLLLGRPESEGLIPGHWVEAAVGGNSIRANVVAAVAGAFMYFATLTEVPILQGLIGAGMGQGPALALLLAGPALSLPNMLVIYSVLGAKKTLVFIGLVVVLATISGLTYGALVG